MKKVVLTLLFFIVLNPSVIFGQVFGPVPSPYNSIRQNGVSSMEAYGDTLWISPSLNRNIGNALEWYTPDNADSVTNNKGRVYSLALGKDTVVAGLGYVNREALGEPQTAFGYYFSVDGGETWRYEPHPIDEEPPTKCNSSSPSYSLTEYDPDCGINVVYGGVTYSRIRFTVPEQAPPYEVSFRGNVVYSANFGSGLMRSEDFGQTWQRILLPPDDVKLMVPDDTYSWPSSFTTANGESITINRYDPRSSGGFNLRVFSTLIDSENRVWVGTANGVNVSENAVFAPRDSIIWRHITHTGKNDGLLGNWVIEIMEEPGTGRIWMTNRIVESGIQSRGIVYTEDGGQTFTQMLVGERINDIAFKNGHIFAVGENGLFISDDGGQTWIQSPGLKSPNTFISNSAVYYSAAATTNRVWIGTSDGIASTGDLGQTWEITRVNFPLKGGNIHDPNAPNVDAYAYPNPYSPDVHDLLRIKFEVRESGNVRVRIFDYGMNLVREVENSSFSPGTYEAVWDGYDQKGRKAANGPYFYVIETAGGKVNGKFLLVE